MRKIDDHYWVSLGKTLCEEGWSEGWPFQRRRSRGLPHLSSFGLSEVLAHDIQSLDWRGTDLGYDVGGMGYGTDGTEETDGNGSDATDGTWVR